jgi:hypothetical protein
LAKRYKGEAARVSRSIAYNLQMARANVRRSEYINPKYA